MGRSYHGFSINENENLAEDFLPGLVVTGQGVIV